jgi:hypothetical protein
MDQLNTSRVAAWIAQTLGIPSSGLTLSSTKLMQQPNRLEAAIFQSQKNT